MTALPALIAESDRALGALAVVDDAAAPAAARHAGERLHVLAAALEEQGESGAALLFDELVALCRAAAAADAARRAPVVAAVRDGFARLTASGAATRAAVESVTAVNNLRALRGTAPVRLGALLAATPPVAAASLPPNLVRRARQWRAWFQKGLAAWLRGESESAEMLRTVLARVAGVAGESPSHAFWQAAALFADALPPAPAAAGADDRRLLVRLDGALRRLADEGTAVLDVAEVEATDELLAALVRLRPLALPPRGAARAALLRHLQAEIGAFRAGVAERGERRMHTVPLPARRAADTLGLLEMSTERRRLLGAFERLRAGEDEAAVAGQLSRVMFGLEVEARLATGEPAPTPPPLLARELGALAELLAAPPASRETIAPGGARDIATRDAALLATLSSLEERRDRVESGLGAARQRLLDVELSTAAMTETLAQLERDGGGEAAADLRAQLATLVARAAALRETLRETRAPLVEQSRIEQRLRRMLDQSSLASLRAVLEQRAREAAGGRAVQLHLRERDDGLHLPMQTLGEALGALLGNAAATVAAGDTPVELTVAQARQGAWIEIAVERPADGREDARPELVAEAGRCASRLGGRLCRHDDGARRVDWLRLPHREAMRSLLRVEVGARRFAAPMADVRAVLRGTALGADGAAVDLRALLGADASRPARVGLRIDVEGDDATVLVDAVDELPAGTPLPLSTPLDRLPGLAAAAMAGGDGVLAVLDLAELVLAARAEQAE